MTTSVFTARSQLRHPGQFLRTSFRSLRASLPLARKLFWRDLKARYRMSVLGFLWVVLPALAQAAVLLYLNASNIVNSGPTGIPLTVFVLVGTVLWQTFVDALLMPGGQLTAASQMLARLNVPVEALLLGGLADIAVNTVARLVIVVPVLVWFEVWPGTAVLLVPVGLAALAALGLALGLLVAPFGVLYHDVGRSLALITTFWLLVTPVGYVTPDVGPARAVSAVNPVRPPLLATRSWITGGHWWPGPSFVVIAVISLVLVVVGWLGLRLALPHLVDRFGA